MASVMKLKHGTAFGCFPEGTLLFEPPKITKYVFPIRTAGLVSYLCDVEVPFVYMDPPQGLTNASTSVGYGIPAVSACLRRLRLQQSNPRGIP